MSFKWQHLHCHGPDSVRVSCCALPIPTLPMNQWIHVLTGCFKCLLSLHSTVLLYCCNSLSCGSNMIDCNPAPVRTKCLHPHYSLVYIVSVLLTPISSGVLQKLTMLGNQTMVACLQTCMNNIVQQILHLPCCQSSHIPAR